METVSELDHAAAQGVAPHSLTNESKREIFANAPVVLVAAKDTNEEPTTSSEDTKSKPPYPEEPLHAPDTLHETSLQGSQSDKQIIEEQLRQIVEIVEASIDGSSEDQPRVQDRKHEKPNYHALIKEAKEEIKDLSTENKVLQRRLLAMQKRRSTIGTKLFLEGAEAQYQIVLKQWMDVKDELDNLMDEYNNKIDRMQEIVKEKQQEARALHQEFSAYKWQVARDAKHVYSGRKLCTKLLNELEAKDLEADVEIERLRIEGRQLASQLKKIQLAILKKDQLPGDLYAVDFEQLKIENESLNEKLSKKNKELVELGKKTTHVVHVLSHSQEKLHFAERKIKDDKNALELLESDLNRARLELQHIKIACERLSIKRERIQTTVNVRTLPLLDDMEAYRDEAKVAEKELKDLKHEYDTLVKHIKKMQGAIRQDSSTYVIGCKAPQPAEHKRLRWGTRGNMHAKPVFSR